MCGIAVALGADGPDDPLTRPLASLHAAQTHRGPDDEAFLWIDADGKPHRAGRLPGAERTATPWRLAIGFNHLKVRDRSGAATQPLGADDGRHWIVMNGELYNASELREQLASRRHVFRTRSDTEVALAAYREWGTGCFERFNGMWALLVVDLVEHKLVGSRDRLGIKPLYYTVDGGRLLFASEPRALAGARRGRPSPDPHRFAEFLRGLPPQHTDRTFFRHVRPVPAASWFALDLDAAPRGPRCRPYWDLHDFVADESTAPPLGDAAERIRDLLIESVSRRTDAEVPVGCLLSGGLDSSFVARIMANQARDAQGESVPAYSIVFDSPQMSELPFVWTVVRQGGLRSHTFELSPERAWADVDAVVRAQGQPLLGQDLIAQYHAYRLARANGSIVVLDGQGADELLAGIPSYAAVMLDELLAGRRPAAFSAELWHQARARTEPLARALWGLLRRRRRAPTSSTAAPAWLEPGRWPPTDPEAWTPSADRSLLNRFLFSLVTRTNLPTVLQYQDRSSMAHGVESRVPYLDHRLVEYCFQLPSAYKVARGVRKRVLRESARGIVPAAVLSRRDNKAFISSSDWIPLRTAHAAALGDMAASATMRESAWFVAPQLQSHVDGYLRGDHDDRAGVWRLYTAWRWMELFGVD